MSAPSPIERLARCMTGEVEPGLDWVELIGTANEERVVPALYRRLLQSGAAPHVDEDALEYLQSFYEANRERNRRIWRLFHEVVGGFNAAGVVPLLIKGGSDLARRNDPADVSRILADVDIVVTPAELPDAERVLTDLGLATMEDTRFEHSPGSYWREGEVAPVDLHIALPGRLSTLLPEGEPPRTVSCERDGIRFVIPDVTLHFFITITHEMLHDKVLLHGTTKLRYLPDLAEQAGDRQAQIDWDWLTAMRTNRSFRLALDLQRLMLRHLLGADLDRFPEPGLEARFLHRRRIFKLRQPELGYLEWRIVRQGFRMARSAGLQVP